MININQYLINISETKYAKIYLKKYIAAYDIARMKILFPALLNLMQLTKKLKKQ